MSWRRVGGQHDNECPSLMVAYLESKQVSVTGPITLEAVLSFEETGFT